MYEPWAAMSWLIAGGATALFFAWRAVLVRTGRDGPTGQNRLRWMAGGLVAISVIVALANSDSPSTFDGGELAAYVVVAGIGVLAQGLYMLIVGLPSAPGCYAGQPRRSGHPSDRLWPATNHSGPAPLPGAGGRQPAGAW